MGQENPDWRYLPKEILGHIFSYLTRYDKLAFTLVCPQWDYATDTPTFWKKVTVRIDEDFFGWYFIHVFDLVIYTYFSEPSLIFLTKKYFRYIKILEIGWTSPPLHNLRLSYMKHKDVIKRVGKFLIFLYERFVQIQHLIIFDWYDIYHLRKLSYLLLRFLKYVPTRFVTNLSNTSYPFQVPN